MVPSVTILNSVTPIWSVWIIIVTVRWWILNIGQAKHQLVNYALEKIFFSTMESVTIFPYQQIRPLARMQYFRLSTVYQQSNTTIRWRICWFKMHVFSIGHQSFLLRRIQSPIIFNGHLRIVWSNQITFVTKL